ncbi:tetratricopeptide repeat protein [Sphingomonas silueang]|uniref:tetratricopeptide repeat protein n=1 Tax=Sphingomonas silueang TaxID=3156617 RepID=UPI0032B41495
MRRLSALPLLALVIALPAAAQQTQIDARVNKLEREMRAVQRKVFPGGAPNQVEPQITAPTQPTDIPGTPASGPIATLEARLSALESQQQTLTNQIEQAQYKQRQLEEQFIAYRRATDQRLTALENNGAGVTPASPGAVAASGDTSTAPPPATRGPGNGGGTLGSPRPAPAATTPAADPARAARIAAIEKPASGDAAEDGYLYGFRLWSAKLYPEAIAALKPVVDKYPQHRRASYAQNLIGRSYLDDGKPSLASIAFYDNYKKMPDGERAPDSLFYLADALIKLKKTKEACDVYGELSDVYGDRISAQMKADIAKGRTTARCAA